ncbi:hypothetical protein TNCV_1363731 [Trichonephila clavipes]|uniref:DUF5641 domain-containing protein n=1 Tax=Trichonephila clavipes TaxID=2585209 RepID=A0A8X6V1E8_TRICX|nr:hypothetical protein TNCV_1363731 [Trichonephila clavipes]
MACPKYSVACHHWHACHWFAIPDLGQLREQMQHYRKSRPLTVGEVVVVENSLKNRTLWSLARVIQLIPGKDGHQENSTWENVVKASNSAGVIDLKSPKERRGV